MEFSPKESILSSQEDPAHSRLPERAAPRWLWDVLFLSLLAVFWAAYVGPIVLKERRHGGDILRDIATAINVQNGQYFCDPAYRGESAWYPPLSPIVVGVLARFTGLHPLVIYTDSALFVNFLVPAGMYLLVRLRWGTRAAAVATVALVLAVPWWQVIVDMAQPSTHAVIWGWVALLLYFQQRRRQSMGWALACGALQGLSFWHHPIVPAVLTAAFTAEAAWEWWLCPDEPQARRELSGNLRRTAVIVLLSVTIACPVLYMSMRGPIRNPFPHHYLAAELGMRRFALMSMNPWIWGTGIAGIIWSRGRKDVASRLLLICLGICALAQVPGYLRIIFSLEFARWMIPLPHEYQMLFQLCWAVAMGVGIDALLKALETRSRLAAAPPSKALLIGAALLATGAIGLARANENLRYSVHLPMADVMSAPAKWIRANTGINEVFVCAPELGWWLNAATGRKVWVTEVGHSNPRVDYAARMKLLGELAHTLSTREFWQLLHDNGIDYCAFTTNWRPEVVSSIAFRESLANYLEPISPDLMRVRPKPLNTE